MLPARTARGRFIAAGLAVDPRRRAMVLAQLAATGTVAGAARATGVAVTAINRLRRADPGFDEACAVALGRARLPRSGENAAIGVGRRRRFCEELARTGDPAAAAEKVGVSEAGVYALRERDAKFAADWRHAMMRATDRLLAAVFARDLATAVATPAGADGKASPRAIGDMLLMALVKRYLPIAPPAAAVRYDGAAAAALRAELMARARGLADPGGGRDEP